MVGQTRVIATSTALLILLAVLPASAEEAERDFESVVSEALQRYNEREFLQAAELFQLAYELNPVPELMFNTARAFERAARGEEAILAYEQFLGLENTTAQLRARAAENLSALRQEQAARRRAEQLEAEAERRAAQGDTSTGGTGDGATGGGAGQEPIEPEGPDPLTVTGWGLVGAGAAGLVGAGIVAGLAYSVYNDFGNAGPEDDRQSMRQDVETRSLAADVLWGVGGVLAATGIVILVVQAVRGGDAEEGEADFDEEGAEGGETAEAVAPEVTILPTVGPGGGVALVAIGRF